MSACRFLIHKVLIHRFLLHCDARTSCVAVILYLSKVPVVLVESSDTPDIHDWFKSVSDVSISSTSRLPFKLNPTLPTIGEGRPSVSLVCKEIKLDATVLSTVQFVI